MNSAEKILYRKSAQIFEELGFLMPRPDNGTVSPNGSTSALVHFNGAFSGCLMVSLNAELLLQLSGNMLGEEKDLSEALQQDSLREIANVICGNALPAIYGFEPIFYLDTPVMCDAEHALNLGAEYSQAAQVHISFDSGIAEVALFVKNSTTAAAPS